MIATDNDRDGSGDAPRILFARITTEKASLSPWYDDFVEAIDDAYEDRALRPERQHGMSNGSGTSSRFSTSEASAVTS